MRPRLNAQAAVLDRAVAERDPRRDQTRLRQMPVEAVLVPRHELSARMFGEERGGVDEDVGPDDLLDSVEHARMRAELVRPAEVEMALPEKRRLRPRRELGLELLDVAPKARPLRVVEDGDRKEHSGLLVPLHVDCVHHVHGIILGFLPERRDFASLLAGPRSQKTRPYWLRLPRITSMRRRTFSAKLSRQNIAS